MVFVRSDIMMNAALYMKKAVAIAIRYNLVRRQSNPGGQTAGGDTAPPGMELQVGAVQVDPGFSHFDPALAVKR